MTHASSRRRPHHNVTFALVALGALTYTLLQAMLVPALPLLQDELHTTQSHVSWVFTAFLLSASVATPVLGRLGDMFGKRRVLIGVYVAVVLGSVVAALAESLAVMVVARAVQGVGGAIFPLAFGIIRDEFPRERVAGAIGGVSAILGIGSGLGIVLAGPIIEHLSWHWLFWTPFAMGLVALVATVALVPESPVTAPGRINVPAMVTLSGWLSALLIGVSQGGQWGWTSGGVLGLFAASIALFAAWVLVELRSREPLVDVRMMRLPAVWRTNLAALLFGFGMYSTMVVIPAFMETPSTVGYGFGSTPTQVGLAMLPNTLGMLIVGLLIGRITARFGSRLPLIIGGALCAVSTTWLAFAHSDMWMFYAALTVFGFGMGLAFSALTNVIVEAVPQSQTGVATGMNANIRTIGGAIGSQVVSAIIMAEAVEGRAPAEVGYTHGLVAMSVALALAAVIAVVIPRNRGVDGEPPAEVDADLEPRGVERAPVAPRDLALAGDAVLMAAASEGRYRFS